MQREASVWWSRRLVWIYNKEFVARKEAIKLYWKQLPAKIYINDYDFTLFCWTESYFIRWMTLLNYMQTICDSSHKWSLRIISHNDISASEPSLE